MRYQFPPGIFRYLLFSWKYIMIMNFLFKSIGLFMMIRHILYIINGIFQMQLIQVVGHHTLIGILIGAKLLFLITQYIAHPRLAGFFGFLDWSRDKRFLRVQKDHPCFLFFSMRRCIGIGILSGFRIWRVIWRRVSLIGVWIRDWFGYILIRAMVGCGVWISIWFTIIILMGILIGTLIRILIILISILIVLRGILIV